MIGLLDANMLIALFDAAHVDHQRAHGWLSANRSNGWATCPLTENACIRVMSQPSYPGRLAVEDIAGRLHRATQATDHHFWPDDIRLTDATKFDYSLMPNPRHLTDNYLLALAVHHSGCLVTFDRGIRIQAILGANVEHLVVLSP
jgi:toxin-antitoxin system PIN domain toxin